MPMPAAVGDGQAVGAEVDVRPLWRSQRVPEQTCSLCSKGTRVLEHILHAVPLLRAKDGTRAMLTLSK